jgi:ribosome-associated toxin RatA of RatAB toxin-antitoxin module
MKHVRKSVLLWYSPLEMYDLVAAIEAYPQFLPWCNSAQVLHEHDDGVTARLGLAYMGVHHAFTTRNVHVPAERVGMELVDGPFSRLTGAWLFKPLGAGGGADRACKVAFDLSYAFSSKALEKVVSPVFDKVADTFVERFVRRAEEVYGPR